MLRGKNWLRGGSSPSARLLLVEELLSYHDLPSFAQQNHLELVIVTVTYHMRGEREGSRSAWAVAATATHQTKENAPPTETWIQSAESERIVKDITALDTLFDGLHWLSFGNLLVELLKQRNCVLLRRQICICCCLLLGNKVSLKEILSFYTLWLLFPVFGYSASILVVLWH